MKWTGAMVVREAHWYTVEADSYEQARERIKTAFANGEVSDDVQLLDCSLDNGIESQQEDEA